MRKYFKYANYYSDLKAFGPTEAELNLRKRYARGGALGGALAGFFARPSNPKVKILDTAIGFLAGGAIGNIVGKRKARTTHKYIKKYEVPQDTILKNDREFRETLLRKKIEKHYNG